MKDDIVITKLSTTMNFNKIKSGFMTVFCLVTFINQNTVSAQALSKAQDVDGTIQMGIGDVIPDTLWNMPLQVVNHPEGMDIIKLQDYRDRSLIVLDFWATWCAGCLKSMPAIHRLEKEMGNVIKVLPVTYQSDSIVTRFLNKVASPDFENIKDSFYSIVNSRYLNSLFKAKYLPHIVIIDQNGVIRARTTPDLVTPSNLLGMISDPLAKPIPVQINEVRDPILISNSEKHKESYYSALASFDHSLPFITGSNIDTASGVKHFFHTNAPIIRLFASALKYDSSYVNGLVSTPSRRIFEVSDPYRYNDRGTIGGGFWFTYETVRPIAMEDRIMMKRMYRDLMDNLNLEARYEYRNTRCLVLRVKGANNLPLSKSGEKSTLILDGLVSGDGTRDGRFEQAYEGGTSSAKNRIINMRLSSLVYSLNNRYRLSLPYFIDETDLDIPLDLVLPDDLNNISDFQDVFLKQGLELKWEERMLEMFVLKEPGFQSSTDKLVMTSFGYVYGE